MTHRFSRRALLVLALTAASAYPARADDVRSCKLAGIASLPVVMEDDRASLAVAINGKDTRIWLDSGAFFNFMPKAKAVELGLATEPLPPGFFVSGIGGSYTPELARVHDFALVGAHLHDMQFVVGGSDAGNGFLGANLLGVFDTEFDLAKGRVRLFKANHCNKVGLAYWSAGMVVGEARLLSPEYENDHHILVEVMVNGHPLRAMLDTGAPTSIITYRAAERAGIDMTSPQVLASIKMGGVGSRVRQTWIARVATMSIGGEEIRNTPIHIIDGSKDALDTDMLLGVDFLMAHHVLVAQSQHKMYLTYNGGPIFSVSTDRETGPMKTRAENLGAAEVQADPTTADGFAGRGSGRMARKDFAGAIADFTAAIKLAPARADLLSDRASAYFRAAHPDLGARDIEAALVIAPHDHRLLLRRANIRLGKGDKAGALADADAAAATTPRGSLDVMPLVGLYERLGKADRGVALLDPVIALHRDDSAYAVLLNARSWNRALANADLDRALRDITIALRKADNAPAMLDTRALVQLRRRDYAAAIADASAALAKAPKLASSLYIRALAQSATGDAAAAQTDMAAARAIRPGIGQFYADYGLIAPAPAKPAATDVPGVASMADTDDDDDDQ